MNVIASIDSEGSLTVEVTEVHPVALADAVRYAVDATVQLAERLRAEQSD